MRVTIVSKESTRAKTGSEWVTTAIITDDNDKVVSMLTGGSSPIQAAAWVEKELALRTAAKVFKQPLDLSMNWT
jgi:hypothetical protein